MALNPLIPMSGHLPNPIDTQGIQENAQQIDLNKARVQEEQIKAQQAQQDQNDQQTMQQEFVNPSHLDQKTGQYNWDSYRNAVAGKVSMRSLRQLDADHLTQVKALQDQATADRTLGTLKIQQHADQNKLIGQELSGLASLRDEDKPAYYQAALGRLKAAGINLKDYGYPDTIPGDGSFNDHINAMMVSAGYNSTLLSNAAKDAKADKDKAAGARLEQQAKDDATRQLKEEAAQEYHLVSRNADPQAAHDAFIERWKAKLPGSGIENLAGKYSPDNQDALDLWAQKSQQRATNYLNGQRVDNQANALDAAAYYRSENLRLREEAAARAADKSKKETALEHKEAISKLADQAVSESNSQGGNGTEDALKNVENTGFYQNHPIGDSRGEIAMELRRRIAAGTKEMRDQQAVDAKDQLGGVERLQWMKDHPGQPIPTKTQLRQQQQSQKKPATPAPANPLGGAAQPPAAPAVTPPAAQNPAPAPVKNTYTEADIRAWAKRRGSDPDAAVKAARDKRLIP